MTENFKDFSEIFLSSVHLASEHSMLLSYYYRKAKLKMSNS